MEQGHPLARVQTGRRGELQHGKAEGGERPRFDQAEAQALDPGEGLGTAAQHHDLARLEPTPSLATGVVRPAPLVRGRRRDAGTLAPLPWLPPLLPLLLPLLPLAPLSRCCCRCLGRSRRRRHCPGYRHSRRRCLGCCHCPGRSRCRPRCPGCCRSRRYCRCPLPFPLPPPLPWLLPFPPPLPLPWPFPSSPFPLPWPFAAVAAPCPGCCRSRSAVPAVAVALAIAVPASPLSPRCPGYCRSRRCCRCHCPFHGRPHRRAPGRPSDDGRRSRRGRRLTKPKARMRKPAAARSAAGARRRPEITRRINNCPQDRELCATLKYRSFHGTISPGGVGSIMTPARTRFSSGVPLFCPEPLKFYPAIGFYLCAKSIDDKGGRLGF